MAWRKSKPTGQFCPLPLRTRTPDFTRYVQSWFGYSEYPVILGSQPAGLLRLVGFHRAASRDPKLPPGLASLHAHKTTLEAGHKTFSPKGTLLTDHRLLRGSLRSPHPACQGCPRYTQTSLQGPDVLRWEPSEITPTSRLRKDTPKTCRRRFSVCKRLDNPLTLLCFTSEIQPRKAEKTGSAAKKHAHVFIDLESLRPRKRQCGNRTELKVGQKCCCKALMVWRTSPDGFLTMSVTPG